MDESYPDWFEPFFDVDVLKLNPNELQPLIRISYYQLLSGDFSGLSELLKNPDFKMPPIIRLQLVAMIEGSSEMVLTTKLGENVNRRSKTSQAKNTALRRAVYIAYFIGENGGFEDLMYEAALKAATERFGVGRTQANNIWQEHKETVRQFHLGNERLLIGPKFGDNF